MKKSTSETNFKELEKRVEKLLQEVQNFDIEKNLSLVKTINSDMRKKNKDYCHKLETRMHIIELQIKYLLEKIK